MFRKISFQRTQSLSHFYFVLSCFSYILYQLQIDMKMTLDKFQLQVFIGSSIGHPPFPPALHRMAWQTRDEELLTSLVFISKFSTRFHSEEERCVKNYVFLWEKVYPSRTDLLTFAFPVRKNTFVELCWNDTLRWWGIPYIPNLRIIFYLRLYLAGDWLCVISFALQDFLFHFHFHSEWEAKTKGEAVCEDTVQAYRKRYEFRTDMRYSWFFTFDVLLFENIRVVFVFSQPAKILLHVVKFFFYIFYAFCLFCVCVCVCVYFVRSYI